MGAFVAPFGGQRTAFTSSPVSRFMALEDLEAKLLDEKPKKTEAKKPAEAKKAEAKKPAPAAGKPAPKPKETLELPKYEDLSARAPAKPKAEKPKPAPKPKPEPRPPPKKVVFEKPPKPAPAAPKPKVERKKPTPKPRPTPPVKPQKKAVTSSAPDPNAIPTGLALGAAPLLLAPIVALGGARSVLAKTAARREQIQQEIAAKKAAEAKRALAADTDGGELATALVSLTGCLECCNVTSTSRSRSIQGIIVIRSPAPSFV